jgi:hypothetical protein
VKFNHSLDAAKHSKVLVQGDQYAAPMEESIAQIQKCADDLVREARRKFERILLQCLSTRAAPIYVFSIAVDPLTRMAVDTEKASETDARLENYMLRLLRDRVQESECEPLRL